MPFGQKDYRGVESIRAIISGTLGRHLKGQIEQAQWEKSEAERRGTERELAAYRTALSEVTEPQDIFQTAAQAHARLGAYGARGQQAQKDIVNEAQMYSYYVPKEREPSTIYGLLGRGKIGLEDAMRLLRGYPPEPKRPTSIEGALLSEDERIRQIGERALEKRERIQAKYKPKTEKEKTVGIDNPTIAKEKFAYNQASKMVSSIEQAYPPELLEEWEQGLKEDRGDLYQQAEAAETDVEREAIYQRMEDPSERERLRRVIQWRTAKAKKEGSLTNLHDLGHDVDVETEELIPYKKPERGKAKRRTGYSGVGIH